MAFTLPPLPYSFDALEPHIDAKTMEIHHDKHHAAYVTNLNKALEGHADLQSKSIDELLKNLDAIPENIRTAVRNNGGGHWNHSLFWPLMKKGSGGEPKGDLGRRSAPRSVRSAASRKKFAAAGVGRFGSGWVWLLLKDGKLAIDSTPNQDTPYSLSGGGKAVLGLDVWEHAYYLKYPESPPGLHQGMVEYRELGRRLRNFTTRRKSNRAKTSPVKKQKACPRSGRPFALRSKKISGHAAFDQWKDVGVRREPLGRVAIVPALRELRLDGGRGSSGATLHAPVPGARGRGISPAVTTRGTSQCVPKGSSPRRSLYLPDCA